MLLKDFELRKKVLQKRELLNLFETDSFEFTDTWVPYTSGQVGGYFLQSVNIEKNGEMYHLSIQSIVELITYEIGVDSFDVISGGESRDWDFSNPVAVLLKKPHAKIYKDGKIIGADVRGKRVLHIADLNNEGSSPRDLWVPAIIKAGGSIKDIVFYVDRLEDGVEVMKELNLTSHSVVPLDATAWEILVLDKKITPGIYKSLQYRLTDKVSWAHNALRTYPEKLKNMYFSTDVTLQKKAQKILDVGYPEIKDELLQLINKED